MYSKIITVITFLQIFVNVHSYNPYTNRTTPFIEDIFKGRCNSYQEINVYKLKASLAVNVNCDDAWKTFTDAFSYKDPCKTTLNETSYQELFDMIYNGKKLVDEAIFWSGTREVVHNFTYINSKYSTLEDTFPGFIANDLSWCGCKTCKDGIGYEYCNETCNQPLWPYWELASRTFAKSASDVAYVMVNANPKPGNTAYYRYSTFGRTELPTMGKMKQVKHLKVYLVADIDKQPTEFCGKASMAQMATDVATYGIEFTCIEDPKMVTDLLCAKYPQAKQCQPSFLSRTWKDISIAFIVISIILLILILVILICASRKMCSKFGGKDEYGKFRSTTNPEA